MLGDLQKKIKEATANEEYFSEEQVKISPISYIKDVM